MIRALVLLLAASVSAAAPLGPSFAPETRPLTLAAPEGGPLAFRGAVVIRPEGGVPAGLSGLAMEDGRTALAVSDKGYWARLRLRIEDERLTGVDAIETALILDRAGAPVTGDWLDAEALARDPATGRLWVAFEHAHRIAAYDAPGAAAVAETKLALPSFSRNGGAEGLALAPDGALWAFGERARNGRHPVAVLNGAPPSFAMTARAPFAITGADIGPAGRLWLTERAFSPFRGFHARLRRISPGGADETLLDLPPESYADNIEGVALWRAEGRTWLLLVSDDNGFVFQRNVLALFEVLD